MENKCHLEVSSHEVATKLEWQDPILITIELELTESGVASIDETNGGTGPLS